MYAILEQVIELYNLGVGAGAGLEFNLPHQARSFDKLELNEEALEVLIVYL